MSESSRHVADWSPLAIETLVRPMLIRPLPQSAYERLARYVQLLYRWNERINLTAIPPQEMVQLHLAECLRAAQLAPRGIRSLLDFGSGAGLPGIPIQIARPEFNVLLAESQHKKAAFLREILRELSLIQAEVYAGRVEDLPVAQVFDLVALRAVDKMVEALQVAQHRIQTGGWCMVLTSLSSKAEVEAAVPALQWMPSEPMPGTQQRILLLGLKTGQRDFADP